MDEPEFVSTQVEVVGTNNIVVNRIGLHLINLLKEGFVTIDPYLVEEMKEILWECKDELLKMQEAGREALDARNESIKEIDNLVQQWKESGEDKTAFHYQDPTKDMFESLKTFLIRSIIALRKVVNIGNMMVEEDIEGPQDFLDFAENEFGEDSSYAQWLREDLGWGKELFDLRAKIEHDTLEYERLQLDFEGDAVQITPPLIKQNNCSFLHYMDTTFYNVLTFIEDVIAMLLNYVSKDQLRVVQLSEEQRDQESGFRYKWYPSDEILEDLQTEMNECEQ